MGYAVLPYGAPNCKRFFMNMWFRVPKDSIKAATKEWNDWKTANERTGVKRPRLTGIVPIHTWGKQPVYRGIKQPTPTRVTGDGFRLEDWVWTYPAGGGDEHGCPGQWVNGAIAFPDSIYQNLDIPPTETGYYTFDKPTDDTTHIDPSYIGVDCSGPYPMLAVNIVMPQLDDGSPTKGLYNQVKSTEGPSLIKMRYNIGPACPGGPGTFDNGLGNSLCMTPTYDNLTNVTNWEDGGHILLGRRPETFRTLPLTRIGDAGTEHIAENPTYNGIEIEENKWHCVTLVFDGRNKVSTFGNEEDVPVSPEGPRTKSAARMWIAVNDVNYVKDKMSYYWPKQYKDKNAILTVTGKMAANTNHIQKGTIDTNDCHGNAVAVTQFSDLPSYEYKPDSIAFSDGPMAWPAAPAYSDMIKEVEHGTFLMFTDVDFNPAEDKMRRLLITDKGKPAPIRDIEDYFEKKAEIKMHGIKNWQDGVNIGTYKGVPGLTEDEKTGFTVGDIEQYKPDPNLYGDQGR